MPPGRALARRGGRGRRAASPFPAAPVAMACAMGNERRTPDGPERREGVAMDASALADGADPDGGALPPGAIGEAMRPETMRETIARRLASLIGSGALAVGDPLPSERELSAAMGVSRETIRSALTILSARGIVQVAQGSRTTVATDDVGELGIPRVLPGAGARAYGLGYGLDDIHEGRLLVEGHIARLVAGRVDVETLDRLADLIEAQEGATGDPVRYLILDREFHAVIYRACGNRVLSDLATTLYSTLLDHRRRVVSRPGAIASSIDDHRAIFAALAAGDGDALAEAFGVHERRIYETTRQIMEEAGRSNGALRSNEPSMGGPS